MLERKNLEYLKLTEKSCKISLISKDLVLLKFTDGLFYN
jgi:hypothetical protein